MNDEDTRIGLARVEATLAGITRQIDHQDRTQQQLVSLFEERITLQFTSVNDRLDSLAATQAGERDAVEARFRDIEVRADNRFQAVDGRLSVLERFNSKLAGIALACTFLGATISALVIKLTGG